MRTLDPKQLGPGVGLAPQLGRLSAWIVGWHRRSTPLYVGGLQLHSGIGCEGFWRHTFCKIGYFNFGSPRDFLSYIRPGEILSAVL